MKIHIKKESVKEKMSEYQVDDNILKEAVEIAEKLKRSELALFWLKDAAKESEEYFNSWLKDIEPFSKQELIDIMHELGNESLQKFIAEFKNSK